MKKLVFFILLSFWVIAASAQEILKMMPSQPTESDTFDLEFKTILPYGIPSDCPPFMGYTDSIFGDTLVYDLYYKVLGPLPQPGCTMIDTTKGKKSFPSGNYTLMAFWHVIYDNNGGLTLDTGARYASDTLFFSIISTTGLEEFSAYHVELYPNPVKEELNVSLNSKAGEMKISVLDVNGKEYKVPLHQQDSHKWRLTTANLPPGVYILQLSSGEEIYNEKFVKF